MVSKPTSEDGKSSTILKQIPPCSSSLLVLDVMSCPCVYTFALVCVGCGCVSDEKALHLLLSGVKAY